MNDSQYYFYDNRIVKRHDYAFEGKTLRVAETGTNTDLLLIWSDDNHFVVQGTGEYLPDLDGMSFYYEENRLYGY